MREYCAPGGYEVCGQGCSHRRIGRTPLGALPDGRKLRWPTATEEAFQGVERQGEKLGSSLFGVAYGDCDVSVVTVLGS